MPPPAVQTDPSRRPSAAALMAMPFFSDTSKWLSEEFQAAQVGGVWRESGREWAGVPRGGGDMRVVGRSSRMCYQWRANSARLARLQERAREELEARIVRISKRRRLQARSGSGGGGSHAPTPSTFW